MTETKESQCREKSHEAEQTCEQIVEKDHPLKINEFQVDLLQEESMERV